MSSSFRQKFTASFTRLVLANVTQFHRKDNSLKNIVIKNGRGRLSLLRMHESLRLLQKNSSMFRFYTPPENNFKKV